MEEEEEEEMVVVVVEGGTDESRLRGEEERRQVVVGCSTDSHELPLLLQEVSLQGLRCPFRASPGSGVRGGSPDAPLTLPSPFTRGGSSC